MDGEGTRKTRDKSGSGQSQSSELISALDAVIIVIIMIMLKYVKGKRIQKRHKDSPDRVRSNIIPSFTPFHPQHPRYQISPILYNLTNFSWSKPFILVNRCVPFTPEGGNYWMSKER